MDQKLIMKSSPKSYALDPVPTLLVQKCIKELFFGVFLFLEEIIPIPSQIVNLEPVYSSSWMNKDNHQGGTTTSWSGGVSNTCGDTCFFVRRLYHAVL